MAIPIPQFPLISPSPVELKRPPAIKSEPGTLVVIDSFSSTPGFEDHGDQALRAARQHGFKGPTQKVTLGQEAALRQMEQKSGQSSVNQKLGSIRLELSQPGLPAERTRQLLAQEALYQQVSLLGDATAELDQLKKSGLKNSAVNLSYGTSPKNIASSKYAEMARAPANPSLFQFDHHNSNVLSALGVTSQNLRHPDAKISGPERAKLQQGLIDLAESSSDHPELQQARSDYLKAVKDLESRHNSVVVSSGNQELIASDLAKDAHGIRPRIDSKKDENILVNAEVTTVGATRWWKKDGHLSEHLAAYSNRTSEVDIYASGSVGDRSDAKAPPILGTSYAAPRVAAAMAQLHRDHPGLSSRQIEGMLKASLTHQTGGESVLDYTKTATYLQGKTF